MKICVVSDSHDRAPMLAAAVEAAISRGAQAVLHCGDVIGPNTLKPLLALGVPVHVVHGNNLGDFTGIWQLAVRSNGLLHYHGGDASLELGGRRIFLVHYPHYARGMACTGDFDLVCCGHSHKAGVEAIANVRGTTTWLVNPGTVAGLSAPATWAMGDLADLDFSIESLA
ncbi:MAG TPA: metallophosphoesterase [Rhodocyclaceae bacterium]|nr:MAG: YfcE family phosphodiesterase [Betaproteobacteria bacterium CG2_30_68_42]PIV73702.1 MAG: metallophosphoesterase [Rhodocyclales bacterium CG17_big_fil_post_rev_8_21_14_2_50_68_7]PIX73856.1 MAG: metallophosphoesterase [Rhodocyclales bacterium CG_4_10_14_3_um_filter_68_10]PJA58156.1 MAG: metallophosphoesterase [Rhodocyclales bacterium CG_4_9_14_3_um_filter_68_10]HCX34515.1 metallophosphoesterase [Rhodocyclaceae bacterium]